MNAQEHRDLAEKLLSMARQEHRSVLEARDAIDSVAELRAEKDRDHLIARAHVHAILTKGWN